jgi:predicted dehydrogenase
MLLERSDIDAVIVATPSGLHAKVALDAMDSGKHVLVEKPMATKIEDADAMIAKANQVARTLAVVHHNRFNTASRVLKNTLQDGRLGQVLWGSITALLYRPQSYYSESGWRGLISMDGGLLLNQVLHHIDLLLWLVGEVESVRGYRATLAHNIETEDTIAASLVFDNGALGSIGATTCACPRNIEETVTIIGQRGSVVMGGSVLNAFRAWHVDGTPQPELGEQQPKWHAHRLVLEDFVEALRSGRQPAVDGNEARRVLDLIERIYLSTTAVGQFQSAESEGIA